MARLPCCAALARKGWFQFIALHACSAQGAGLRLVYLGFQATRREAPGGCDPSSLTATKWYVLKVDLLALPSEKEPPPIISG